MNLFLSRGQINWLLWLCIVLMPASEIGGRSRAGVWYKQRSGTVVSPEQIAKVFLEAESLRSLGTAEGLRQSIIHYQEVLDWARARKDIEAEATAIGRLGLVCTLLGELSKALDYSEGSFKLWTAIGNPLQIAIMHNNIGAGLDNLGRAPESLSHFEEALKGFRKLKQPVLEGQTYSNLAKAHLSLGEPEISLRLLAKALSIAETQHDRIGRAQALHNIGMAYEFRGDLYQAKNQYRLALPLMKKARGLLGEAQVITNLGTTLASLGEFQEALECSNRALELWKSIGDRRSHAYALHNLGYLYDLLGKKVHAIDFYRQSLAEGRFVDDPRLAAVTLQNLGLIRKSENPQEAVKLFKHALDLSRAAKDQRLEVAVLHNIGLAYAAANDQDKALQYQDRSLSAVRAAKDRSLESNILHDLALKYFASGKPEEAVSLLKQVVSIATATGNLQAQALSLFDLGYIQENLGNLPQALDSYTKSIDLQESLQAGLTLEEFKSSLADETADSYQRAVSLLLRLNKPVEAFHMAERGRSSSFLEQRYRNDLRAEGTPELLREEHKLLSEIRFLDRKMRGLSATAGSLTAPAPAPAGEWNYGKMQLARKRRQLERLRTRLKLEHPKYAAQREVTTLTVPQIQKLLYPDATLLSYYLTSDEVFAFVLTRQSFDWLRLPATADEVREAVLGARNNADLAHPPASLEQLYQWLIDPVKPHFSSRLVGIIPHQILHLLPFSALGKTGRYFGDEHTVFYLTSASDLRMALRDHPGGTLLALGYSRPEGLGTLNHIDEEVRGICALYDAHPLVDRYAVESAVRLQAGQSRILHLAAYAQLNAETPLFSRIFLAKDQADDGDLHVYEILDLNLENTDLVVLSACETNLGPFSPGDDIVALNRAFLAAGASTVIASLWKVDDEATSLLMHHFYTQLRHGKSKATALQVAQAEVREQYPHPYFWASFVLTGDPGSAWVSFENSRR